VAHSGPLTPQQTLRIAVLWAGKGAALAGLTAARLQGFRGFDEKASSIHLLIPAWARHAVRSIQPSLPLVVHYSRNLAPADIHPARQPPQTRIARSLVDAAAWMGTDRGAQAVLAAGVQQRLVRVTDLVAELDRNERLHRRKIISQTLGDIAGGAHALSELDFTSLVVRQFKLPAPDRQVPLRDAHGRQRWLDAVWEKAQLVVEIDGAGHIDVRTYWDDMDRGNGLQLEHYRVLRSRPGWSATSRTTSPPKSVRPSARPATHARRDNGGMIARIWRGWAPSGQADDYQRHYETEVSEHLIAVSGFRGAQLLRSVEGGEVAFTSITWFADLEAVRGFAGDDYEQAVVEDAAQAVLSHWDERVSHHEVAVRVA